MEEHYKELTDIIIKSLEEGEHICKYHKYECPYKDCNECAKEFLMDYINTLCKIIEV